MFNFFKKTLTEEQMKQMDKTIEKFKKNPHQFRFTVMFFISSIVFGLLSIFLLQQKFSLLMKKGGKPEIREIVKKVFVTPSPQVSITPSQEATTEANITKKTSWTLEKSELCNVLLPISPYKVGYDNNNLLKTWIYSETQEKNSFPSFDIFNSETSVSFEETNEDSGTIPGRISILCADNLEKINAKTLTEKIENYLNNMGEIEGNIIAISSNEETSILGFTARKISFTNGLLEDTPYYAIATDNHLYLVSQISQLEDLQVKKDTLNIFNGIIFLD